jgi:hypothetical protein
MDVLEQLRQACAQVADHARQVHIRNDAISAYASSLPLDALDVAPNPDPHLVGGTREELAAFWLTLDAINFGSGWFPSLQKRDGRSGYFTIAAGVRERFEQHGPWSASELSTISIAEVAAAVGQDPEHELMALFAASLNDLGHRIGDVFGGKFAAAADASGGSAVAFVERIRHWRCFADSSTYEGITVPFLKRAQIATFDLASRAGAEFHDLHRLTIFADNLVPHVLRLDGILVYEPSLLARIERQELVEHGTPEEVEIRASAVHAVELIAACRDGARAADIDKFLWNRGQEAYYKARPRHRCRCTAY